MFELSTKAIFSTLRIRFSRGFAYNECRFSVVGIALTLWRMVCTVISIWWFVSAWLLSWDGVLLRWLPSLRIIFSCSPDIISRSFVSTDFAVFMFFPGECFWYHDLNEYFLFHLCIWLRSIVKDLSQCSCSSIRHAKKRFLFLFVGIAFLWCFRQYSVYPSIHFWTAINDCLKELNCSFRFDLKLSSCNWKVVKSFMVLFLVMSKYFGPSLGKDKHFLSATVCNLSALTSIISWSNSSKVSRVISLSRELWIRSNTSFLPNF